MAKIHVGKGPCGIAVGAGSVWVEDYTSNQVSRIDPKTDKATNVRVGLGPYDVTFADGAAWVTNNSENTVSRIDPATNRARTIDVGASPTGVAPAGGAVWVTDKGDGTIARIDPATLAVRRTHVGDFPAWTAWGDGQLWVADGDGIDQVDLATGRSGHHVQFGATVNDGDILAGKVWVTDASGDLHEIDARTGQVLGHWDTRLRNPFVLAGYAGALWVVDFKGTKLEEINPSKLS
jgi:YVTN family beta-propeller protein